MRGTTLRGVMRSLPGWAWLREHLAQIEESSGGWTSKQGNVVKGGAAFVLQALLVLAWAVALVPMLLWRAALGRPSRV